LYCCLVHCIWMKQAVCHFHLHIWHLKGLYQGMISVAALHEMRLAVCGCALEGNDSHLVSKMSSLYKSQSRLHEQVWWRNEFCKGSPGE